MHAEIVKLIAEEQLSPMQITVLVCGQPKNQYYKLLEKMPLPQSIPWCVEDAAHTMGVRVDTVKRFKGLEFDAVFFCNLLKSVRCFMWVFRGRNQG